MTIGKRGLKIIKGHKDITNDQCLYNIIHYFFGTFEKSHDGAIVRTPEYVQYLRRDCTLHKVSKPEMLAGSTHDTFYYLGPVFEKELLGLSYVVVP
jgi:hypothetical protein